MIFFVLSVWIINEFEKRKEYCVIVWTEGIWKRDFSKTVMMKFHQHDRWLLCFKISLAELELTNEILSYIDINIQGMTKLWRRLIKKIRRENYRNTAPWPNCNIDGCSWQQVINLNINITYVTLKSNQINIWGCANIRLSQQSKALDLSCDLLVWYLTNQNVFENTREM